MHVYKWAPRQGQPDCTRRQGLGTKTNLNQPWPKRCKIIKKKSLADRGWDEIGLSLVHYGSRLTREHIWIAHTALIKQLAASTTGSEDYKVNMCHCESSCVRTCMRIFFTDTVSYNVANYVKMYVFITVKVNLKIGRDGPLMWSPACLLLWQHDSHTERPSHSQKPRERTGSDTICKNFSFPSVVCFSSVRCHMGLDNVRKCGCRIDLS